MFDTGAVLATVNVEFYVKYKLPEFLNQALANFFMFFFSISSMLEFFHVSFFNILNVGVQRMSEKTGSG